MDDWMIVTLLSLAMLIGCYIAGCIPLAFSLPEDKLKLLTIFGAGLLVGTALTIIIPEGIETMYHTPTEHVATPYDLSSVMKEGPVVQRKLRQANVVDNIEQEVGLLEGHGHQKIDQAHQDVEHAHEEGDHDHLKGDQAHSESQHKFIGVALVSGFVFMLLVDQVGGASHSHGGGTSSQIEAGPSPDAQSAPVTHSRHRITATIGLCVHAAADGVALGAATSVKQHQLTLIVFVAIMLHKAPAAFGLVSFLLHDSMDRSRIRRHLLAFSLAAPAASIVTFLLLNTQSKEWLSDYNATGLAMLFSAGTFLYVSTVHILPEVSSKTTKTISSDGTVIIREHKGFTKPELLSIVMGSIFPLFISIGHSHGH